MKNSMMDLAAYKGKKVFVTGHTGFKGTWLCQLLTHLGAEVTGFSHEEGELYSLVRPNVRSTIGDIRDHARLEKALRKSEAGTVIHLAAQAIVKRGYEDPAYTYDVNVGGLVHLLEAIRTNEQVKSVVIVTTDKVYREGRESYRESDALGGSDPYSSSKACCELIVNSYRQACFAGRNIAISTARAGNTIGGGDFGEYRLLADALRATVHGDKIILRNPESSRPYQHVLDALAAYLVIADRQTQDQSLQGAYNIGPWEGSFKNKEIIELFCEHVEDAAYTVQEGQDFREADRLALDVSLAKESFGWENRWTLREGMEEVAAFVSAYRAQGLAEPNTIRRHMNHWVERYCLE